VLRGYGTPTIDGVIGAGEWQSTGRFDAPVALPPELGGGTVPATLYLMNDTQNLYIALMVGTASIIGDNSFLGAFDNDHNGTLYEQGHESLEFRRTGGTAQFLDGFIQRLPNGYCWCWDVDYGGTSEITGAYTRDSGASYYELAHPLDTADDGHDFSMRLGRRAGLAFDYIHCVATQCAFTRMPPYASGNPPDVSIVSNDHTPPDTQLTSGPQEGSIVARPTSTSRSPVRTRRFHPRLCCTSASLTQERTSPARAPIGSTLWTTDRTHSRCVRSMTGISPTRPRPRGTGRWTANPRHAPA
jgi:hypothetical protein